MHADNQGAIALVQNLISHSRAKHIDIRFHFIWEYINKRMQKGIAHWDKQDNDVPAPNCMLKVQGEIIKDEGL